MTQTEQEAIWMIKGVIADLPPAMQAQIKDYHDKIMLVVEEGGDAAKIAVALIGAEFASKG